MEDNIKNSTKVQLFIVVWYIFISQLVIFSITQYSAVIKLLVLAFIPWFRVINFKKIRLHSTDWLWLSAITMFGLQATISTNLSGGMFAVIKLIAFFVLFLFLSRSFGWQEKCIKLLIIFSGIHVACTILQFFAPNLINLFNSRMLSAESFSTSLDLYSYGAYAGIAEQTGFNAMFIAIFIACISSRILILNQGRIKNVILLLIGFVALLLTAKRGALIAILLAEVIGIILSIKSRKNLRKIVPICVVVLLIYFITVNIPALQFVFQRFEASDNFMSNRDVLYSIMLEGIKYNPILGKGTGSLSTALSVSGHNIYLQMLYENGIVGVLLILGLFANALVHTWKILKKHRDSEQTDGRIQSTILASFMIQIYFLINGLTESVFYNPTMFASYVVMIAMSYNLYYKNA